MNKTRLCFMRAADVVLKRDRFEGAPIIGQVLLTENNFLFISVSNKRRRMRFSKLKTDSTRLVIIRIFRTNIIVVFSFVSRPVSH